MVINFGQLGDVILGLSALRAIRTNFPDANITAMTGKSPSEIVKMSGFADEQIIVDRVELRDGPKLNSIKTIWRLLWDVRARKFDLIIDLHSLPETNILGFLSGAKARLYANRESRSLDSLGSFTPKPLAEDKAKVLNLRYLDVIAPLIPNADASPVHFKLDEADKQRAAEVLADLVIDRNKPTVGLFPGAGHPSRCWQKEKFAELASLLNPQANTVVFFGPEEAELLAAAPEIFPKETKFVSGLKLRELLAVLAEIDVLVSNDTGIAHLGALGNAAIVVVMDKNAPLTYLPLTEKLSLQRCCTIDQIPASDVYDATINFLNS